MRPAGPDRSPPLYPSAGNFIGPWTKGGGLGGHSIASYVAASIIAMLVLSGCFYEFAQYYFKGSRSRNPSYLLAAVGLFFMFFSLVSTPPLRLLLLLLMEPAARFAAFLAGCLFLLGSLALFLYITYVRPHRLRFEDAMVEDLPSGPPPEEQ